MNERQNIQALLVIVEFKHLAACQCVATTETLEIPLPHLNERLLLGDEYSD